MIKNLLFYGLFIGVLFGCANSAKSLNGKWQQVFQGYADGSEAGGFVSDLAIVDLNLSKPIAITFDYNDGLEMDYSDSIHYKYPQLNFRKLNQNQQFNRYQMTFKKECDCFEGSFKSFSGRTVLVKWLRYNL